ncbi:MAG: WYL domain-containing protein [Coprobacillus sp.]|nr:WYL domain-containing protein [Coprobacillus sp.]
MDISQQKKASVLLVLKVLQDYTDENHHLTQNEIAEKIKEIYGLSVERKSIASSLAILDALDYDVNSGKRGGYYLLSRELESSEVAFIVDAIFSSKSIPANSATKLVRKVNSCLSIYERKEYDFVDKTYDLTRTNNSEIFYTIDIIHEAMEKHKRVGFQYLTYDKKGKSVARNDGYEYVVSPYFLVNNFGNYYLLCNYRTKYNPLNVFRLDYITNIRIRDDWELKDMSEIEELRGFDLTSYLNEHIYLIGGEAVTAYLEVDTEEHVRFVIDWFGDNAVFVPSGDKIVVKVKCNETSLLYWCLQYSLYIKVLEPESLKQKVIEAHKSALAKYEADE